jgi:hypothetical protein
LRGSGKAERLVRDIHRGGGVEFGLDDGGGLMGRLRVCGRLGWGVVAVLVLSLSEEDVSNGFVPDEALVLGLSPAHLRRASRSVS